MSQALFIGLMSGTSMDGVDGVLAHFNEAGFPTIEATHHEPFDASLRTALFALQSPGENELEREALAALKLADVYAACCAALLRESGQDAQAIVAIGAHGQTIRHRPELGYTRQTNNPARLAELTGIDVVADFRSRDVAAGGQGAPLVPAFHAIVFGLPGENRVICNIGGISNVSLLQGREAGGGFDCGPGNVLMDIWAMRCVGQPYDQDGRFAASGKVDQTLLNAMLSDPYFTTPPPKSTGRDLFNAEWLDRHLTERGVIAPEDVQATLTELTAQAIARDILTYAPACQRLFLCGGGARNGDLVKRLRMALDQAFADGQNDARQPSAGTSAHATMQPIEIDDTSASGIDAQHVEALAFAWLAQRFVTRQAGNLPAVTGAAGSRVLGALYPR